MSENTITDQALEDFSTYLFLTHMFEIDNSNSNFNSLKIHYNKMMTNPQLNDSQWLKNHFQEWEKYHIRHKKH